MLPALLLAISFVFTSAARGQGDPLLLGLHALQAGNYEVARLQLEPLAQAGDTKALYLLSEIHGKGLGVPADTALAGRYLTRSAEAGYAIAQFNLGNHYVDGDWLPADAAKAAYWWRLAAGQGMPQAQYNLGSLYLMGRGVGQDREQARFWFRQAADAGSRRALQALQVMASQPGELGLVEAQSATPGRTRARPAADRAPATVLGQAAKTKDEPNATVVAPGAAKPGADFSGLALGPDWLKSQPSASFTLQLFASDTVEAVRRFLTGQRFARQVAVFPFEHQGGRWYGVVYGRFETRSQASSAAKELPQQVQAGKPWARSFGQLQAMILPQRRP